MRVPHALDGWMQSRHRGMIAGDEASRERFIARRDQPCPEVTRSRTIVDHDTVKPFAFEGKNDILVFHVFGPTEPDKLIGTPAIQKTQKGLQSVIGR